MVFQNYALWPHLSAVDTVAYPARRRGAGRAQARAEALEILDRLHIGHLAHRKPAELSGGEQQRVGLARALARRPSVYLFDEPTAHLDTHVRGVFLEELVARQHDSGAAAVYATHDAEEALGLADRVALLRGGRVIQIGTPQQVYGEPVDLFAARLTGPASLIDAPEAGGRVLVRPGMGPARRPSGGRPARGLVPGPAQRLPARGPAGRGRRPGTRPAAAPGRSAGPVEPGAQLAPERARRAVGVDLVRRPAAAGRPGPSALPPVSVACDGFFLCRTHTGWAA